MRVGGCNFLVQGGSGSGADAVQLWNVDALRAGVEWWSLVVGGTLEWRVPCRRAQILLSLRHPKCPVTVPGT